MNCSALVEPPPDMRFRWSHNGSVAICYSAVFVLSLLGNGSMFLILFRNQCVKRRRVHSLLLHMTVAQLLVTLVYIPKEIVHNLTIAWLGGDLLCRLCKFFDVFGVTLSAGILVCLSLDRFYSILFPLYVINAKRSVQRMVMAAWLISGLSSLPQVYIFRTARHPCFTEFTQCVSADLIGQLSPRVVYWFSVLNIVQVYFLPLLVILVCYGSILVSISLKSNDSNMGGEPEPPQPQKNLTKLALIRGCELHGTLAGRRASSLAPTKTAYFQHNYKMAAEKRQSASGNGLRRTGGGDSYERAKSKTLKMTLVLVLAFLLCWTPYTVAMFIHFLRQSGARPISPLLSKFLYAFAVFNSAISPYLYGYFSFNIADECRQLRYLIFRSAPARCLLGSSDTAEESFSRSRSPFAANAAAIRDSRRRAMIRRESRVREGLLMCDEKAPQQKGGGGQGSVRFVTTHQRAPRLSETARSMTLPANGILANSQSQQKIIAEEEGGMVLERREEEEGEIGKEKQGNGPNI